MKKEIKKKEPKVKKEKDSIFPLKDTSPKITLENLNENINKF